MKYCYYFLNNFKELGVIESVRDTNKYLGSQNNIN